MKLFFDLFPLILFFLSFYLWGIFVATGVAITATFLQVGWLMGRGKKVDNMLWITLAVITLFGGATLLFQNESFIKWKPTVLFGLFAIILIGALVFFKKNLIRSALNGKITLPDPAWNLLCYLWGGFFVFLSAVNLYVAFNYSTEIWVNFKVLGVTGLMLVFAIVQGLIIARYIDDETEVADHGSATPALEDTPSPEQAGHHQKLDDCAQDEL